MTKTTKYPGEIGKRVTKNELWAAVAAKGFDAPLDLDSAICEWIAHREFGLLFELLDHYRIARNDELRWPLLALKLARDHVPAFHFSERRPGRPRKPGPKVIHLVDLLPKPKGKPGRPRRWTDAGRSALLAQIEKDKKELRAKHERRITDKEALRIGLDYYANKKNLGRSWVQENFKAWQNQLAIARQKIPKTPRKLRS